MAVILAQAKDLTMATLLRRGRHGGLPLRRNATIVRSFADAQDDSYVMDDSHLNTPINYSYGIPMNLTQYFQQPHPPAFIPFIMAGHPNLRTTFNLILELEKIGVAAIEIGIPFSDPVA